MARFSNSPQGNLFPSLSKISRSYPRMDAAHAQYQIGMCLSPMTLPIPGHPSSVCHQWSITGVPYYFRAFLQYISVSGSLLSPARNNARRHSKLYFSAKVAFGSTYSIAQKAVGAVNMVRT
eukprot:3042202-Ditylum_brightwellii.AAC.2